jgi:hypothetical protein
VSADVETVRRTLATVRGERDHAHLLLRAVRLAFGSDIPDHLAHQINAAVALESEGDIEDARQAALVALLGPAPADPGADTPGGTDG